MHAGCAPSWHPALCPTGGSTPYSPQVTTYFREDSSTWSYVVVDPGSRAAAIVDPVLDFDPKAGSTGTESAQRLLDQVRTRTDGEWILETHAHADHLSAADRMLEFLPGAKLAIGTGIRRAQDTFAGAFNLGEASAVDGSQFAHLFADRETFQIGALKAQVIAVPSHTNDSVAYLIGDAIFVGDSIFMPDGGTALRFSRRRHGNPVSVDPRAPVCAPGRDPRLRLP